MTVTLAQIEPLIWGGAPLVLGGLLWQVLRYRCPPELVALIATLGLPLAGLWRPALVPYALTPGTWLWLALLLAISVTALRLLPMRDTRDVFVAGLLAGALPAAFLAARDAEDPRSAGRLALVAAGAGAMSPLGGPVQFMLASTSWEWWQISAPAGAVAAAVSWRGNALEPSQEPPPIHPRVRWLIAVMWMGVILQLVGAPWATSLIGQHPPPDAIGRWVWAALAWSGGNFVDPWVLADFGARTIALGAAHEHLMAAVAGVTIPNLAVPVMAWTLADRRAALHGLPGVIAAVATALVLTAFAFP